MKNMRFLLISTLLLILCACSSKITEESNPYKVVDLKCVDGKYEIVCEPIGKEEFAEKFQPGWRCYAIHDVYPDGSIGGNHKDGDWGGTGPGPNRFSVLSDNIMKEYIFWEDADDHYEYKHIPYSYEEDSNKLVFDESFYSVGYHIGPLGESRYETYYLRSGTVISLNESEMDLVAPVCKAWAYENAVYTLFRFKRLSKEKVAQLDSLYTEPR